MSFLRQTDPEIYNAIEAEKKRQKTDLMHIGLPKEKREKHRRIYREKLSM
jgi:hypothetical protein